MRMGGRKLWLLWGVLFCTGIVILGFRLSWWGSKELARFSGGEAKQGKGKETASAKGFEAPEERPRSLRPGGKEHRKKRVSKKGRIRVRILAPEGAKVKGRVYWSTSLTAPIASSMMAPEHGFPLAKKGEMQRAMEREAVLEIPAGHWVWMRVFAVVDQKVSSGYRLFAPFEGKKEFVWTPQWESRGIHVFLCQKDLETPVPDALVRVFWMPTKTNASWELVRRLKTNGVGYAKAEGLKPGRFLLLGPGAQMEEGLPYVQRFLLPASAPMTEIPVTLVAPEKRFDLVLDVQAAIKRGPHKAPKLFLKREGDLMGELVPMKAVLGPGTQKVHFLLPLDDYEVGVLPLGRCYIPQDQRRISFQKPGQKFSLSVMERTKKSSIVLRGLTGRDFPVSVFPVPPSPVFDDQIALMFMGPYRWNLAKQWIPTPKGSFDLIVSGRMQSWLSKGKVAFGGDRVEVELIPATHIQVFWKGVSWALGKGAVLEVRTERRMFRRVLSRRLVPDGGRMVPAFVGNLVVDRGRVSLVCRDEASEKVLWERHLQMKTARKVLEIVGAQPQ